MVVAQMLSRQELIKTLLRIDDKQGHIVPFDFSNYKAQEYFHRNKSHRNIVLKHRQGGLSSSILADMYMDCITVPHTSCAVVSHETRATQRLLDRVQFYYDTMLPPKPTIGAESRSEKTFPLMHSSIYVGTAGSRAFGRGDTIRKVLLSELSFYEDGRTILNGLEDAVPLTGELTIECYDNETEVLTDRGWLLFKDVVLTDKVLTRNVEGQAYWSGILGKVERPATELIHVTGKGIDFRVTPNHNIWARKSRTVQPFKVYQAKELFDYSEWEFDTSLKWTGKDTSVFFITGKPVPKDIWLEFMGFFLSEGWVEKYAVSVYQEGEYQGRFRYIAGKVSSYLGKELGIYTDGYQFTIPGKEFAEFLKPYTKPKRIPKELLELDKDGLSLLLKAYMMGDGEKKRNRCVTKDIPLRDGLQEIGLKLGYRTNYKVNKAKGIHKESYSISFYKGNKPSVRLSREQVRKESYSGMVYCLTLPQDHFLLVRRRGKVVWLQNCTPNGEDNVFHEEWVKAREGKSPYKPFFFPWWWTKDYQIPKGSEYALPDDVGELTYTDEEQDLVTRNSLTEEQIRWRRWKIAEKQGLFWQEYPENEVDCFITVGDPVFDSLMLSDFANNCYEGKRQPSGWLMWLPPDPKLRYVIGADTSSGAPEGSYSAFVVLNDRWEVCATFQGRVEPHAFATILKEVGKVYNSAELAVERNFTGYAVLEQLKDYGNISLQRDFTTGKMTTQRGWWTNDQTRSMMISITRESLGKVKIWDVNLVRQLRSYRYMKIKTKYREQAQTFDDLAMAFMIAVTVRKVAGTARGLIGYVPGWNW